MRVKGIECEEETTPYFGDVASDNQFFPSIQCLRQLNIVSGYSDGLFRPDTLISREQSAKVLYLAFVQEIPVVQEEEGEDEDQNDQIETAPSITVVDNTDESTPEKEAPVQRVVTAKDDVDFIKLENLEPEEDTPAADETALEITVEDTGPNADLRLILYKSPDGKTKGEKVGEVLTKGKEKTPPILMKLKKQDIRAAALQNVIVNGDFEGGASAGWSQQSASDIELIYQAAELGIAPHSGDWAAWLGGLDDDVSLIEQTVTIPATDPAVSFWYFISSEDSCGYDGAALVIDSTVVEMIDLCASANSTNWTAKSISLAD